MRIKENLPKYLVLGFFAFGAIVVVYKNFWPKPDPNKIQVSVPQLSAEALEGQDLFNANCATCHGDNGTGTDKGPPLVHDIYNPGHHPDEAFLAAAAQGVRQHHWPFGNMPSQPQVQEDEIVKIVRYVRELQEANGIFYRQHNM